MTMNPLTDSRYLNAQRNGPSLPQFLLDSAVVKVRHGAETEGDTIGELSKSNRHYGLKDMLLAESVGA
jgi:hypothetical protein